jgi:hypothetical protein
VSTTPSSEPIYADAYVFHGPGGDLGSDELRAYFASSRAAFGDLRIVREQIIVERQLLGEARSTFSGDFTYAPNGRSSPASTSSGKCCGGRRRVLAGEVDASFCLGIVDEVTADVEGETRGGATPSGSSLLSYG